MRSAETLKQPWVDWVEGKQRQLQLLTSIAKMKVEDGMRRPGGFGLNNWAHHALPMETHHLTPRLREVNPQMEKALSCSHQENIMATMRQPSAEPRRASLSNRDLNKYPQAAYVMDTIQVSSCEESLPHLKSYGNSIQEVISKDVLSTAATALAFSTSSTTFDGSCHSQPACAVTVDTLVQSSHLEGKVFCGETLETGNAIFEHEVENPDLHTQCVTLQKAVGSGIVRASGSKHRSGPAVVLQGTFRAPELHSEDVSMNQSTKEPDRPTITWLKETTNKFAGLRKPKNYGMTLNQLFEVNQSSKAIASSSRYCMACAGHVNSQQIRIAESVGWKVRKHVNWHMHERDLSFQKREKTRSGLSCHLLGERDPESHGRPLNHRRKKPEVCAADLRAKVERNSKKDEWKQQRTAQKPVVNLEHLWMKIHEDVGC
ncbi:hypothetical protein Mapa_003917 [Marchantia paleacea]|nr:hypothetical protein Mapa_003917 [Marchantia paleacea]